MAQTKECPSCAMEVAENKDVCPICGYEFAETGSVKKGTMAIAIALLLIFLAYFIL